MSYISCLNSGQGRTLPAVFSSKVFAINTIIWAGTYHWYVWSNNLGSLTFIFLVYNVMLFNLVSNSRNLSSYFIRSILLALEYSSIGDLYYNLAIASPSVYSYS